MRNVRDAGSEEDGEGEVLGGVKALRERRLGVVYVDEAEAHSPQRRVVLCQIVIL